MISNEKQYRATKAAARIFEEALEHADEQGKLISPRIRESMLSGITSELAQLRAQLQEYDDFRTGKVRVLTITDLAELPDVLIRARIASGLTQRELAEELDIKEQQVQRYEATRYKGASLTRLVAVARALDIEIHMQATLPDPVEFRARLRESDERIREMMQELAGAASAAEQPPRREQPRRRDQVA
jgi:transcriptional regulator with XRE-family HTH domain